MDIEMRYQDGEGALSAAGVVDYIGTHLQIRKEAGSLPLVHGYLSKDGKVMPLLYSDIWKQIGWSGQGLPPEALINNLSQGLDLFGKRLTKSKKPFLAPKELIISFPCEVSVAMKDDPEAGFVIMNAVVKEVVSSIEEVAVRKRSGKGRKADPDPAPARILLLAYPHAKNRADEPDLHAHLYIFAPALDNDGVWRVFDNAEHMARLSKPGGARERATDVLIAEGARRGYTIEIERGKATGPGPHGARVTCPDRRIIERGSVVTTRRSEILAAQEMARECGAAPLTRKQIELVRRETGRFPAQLKNVKRLDRLQKKLQTLGFLDPEGRIHSPAGITAACQTMEENMAVAQVTLSDLPMLPHALSAAENIKNKRKALRDQVAGVHLNTNQARIRWTASCDQVLELVAAHPEGLTTDDLDKPTRDNLSKLKRAGILLGGKVHNRMRYTLGPEGEERLARGHREQAEAETLVNVIAHQALEGADSPGQVRGRLEMLGIQTNPPLGRFEIGAVGRVVEDPELVASTGIQPFTEPLPDHPWWERWWMKIHKLPELLKRAIMQPAEVNHRWPLELGQKAAEVITAQFKSRRAGKAKAQKEADEKTKERQRQQEAGYMAPKAPVHRSPSNDSPGQGAGNGRPKR
jgi:hypothetical protein